MTSLPRLAALAVAAALLTACSHSEQPASSSSTSSAAAAPSSSAVATPPPAPPPPPPSDKDQVVAALQGVADAYNTKNWDAYLDLQCPQMRAKFVGPVLEALKSTRDKQGLSSFKVIDVTIDGDSAKVKVQASNESLGTQELTMPMERSDGWKLCATNGVTS